MVLCAVLVAVAAIVVCTDAAIREIYILPHRLAINHQGIIAFLTMIEMNFNQK